MYLSTIGSRLSHLLSGLDFHINFFFTESLTNHVELLLITGCGRMVSALDSVSSGLGSSPGRGRCVVF